MQVRVISLASPNALLRTFRTLFPTADVRVQRGVDVRGVSADALLKAGAVTFSAAHALSHGRKWHQIGRAHV